MLITKAAGLTLNVFHLFEAIPFFVVTIGFEKPYILSKAVIDATLQDTDSPFRDRIWTGVASVAESLLADYAIEVTLLLLAGIFGLQGVLGEFCFLAAFILFFDGLFLFTFYVSFLALKLEVRKITLKY